MQANIVASANAEKIKRFILELAKSKHQELLDNITEAFLRHYGIKDGVRLSRSRKNAQTVFDKIVRDFRNKPALSACITHVHEIWAYSDGLRALGRAFPVAIPSHEAIEAFETLHHSAEGHHDRDMTVLVAALLRIFMGD